MNAFPVLCEDLVSLQLFWVFAAIKSYHIDGSGESTFRVTGDQREEVISLAPPQPPHTGECGEHRGLGP